MKLEWGAWKDGICELHDKHDNDRVVGRVQPTFVNNMWQYHADVFATPHHQGASRVTRTYPNEAQGWVFTVAMGQI